MERQKKNFLGDRGARQKRLQIRRQAAKRGGKTDSKTLLEARKKGPEEVVLKSADTQGRGGNTSTAAKIPPRPVVH